VVGKAGEVRDLVRGEGVASRVRRPTLLGAVLLKARALPVHSRPEDQREDIITLLCPNPTREVVFL
jgi:hypothetical protein